MNAQNTRVLPVSDEALAEASRLILVGEPVAVPTETVYGLAADATSEAAVARVYEAKGRPALNPLIVHVALDEAERHGRLGEAARRLAGAYWPGPLTLVVPRRTQSDLAPSVSAGLSTVALRCPAHPVMQALIRLGGRPLAAPSANASGAISPTRAAHVLASLGGRIPLILDGGATARGLESTIVAAEGDRVRLLRPGPVTPEQIEAVLGRRAGRAPDVPARIEAPGQMRSHYAPAKKLRLDAVAADPDEWLIGFGEVAGDDTLSAAGDVEEAAARLFEALHRADAAAKARIAVAPVPAEGIGLAVNDRLRRAAAPRGR